MKELINRIQESSGKFVEKTTANYKKQIMSYRKAADYIQKAIGEIKKLPHFDYGDLGTSNYFLEQLAEILSADDNEAGLLPYIDALEKKMRK